MTQQRVDGKLEQGKGKVKEEVGKFLGDRSSQWAGKLDQVKGRVKDKMGEAKSTRRFADGRTR